MMMFRTLLLAVVLAASASALTTPHHLRRSAHADLAARRREAAPAPAPFAAGTPSAPVKKAKRQQACKQRPSTTPAATSAAVANVAPSPPAASSPASSAPAAAPANVAPAPQDTQTSSAPPPQDTQSAPAPPPPAPAPAAPAPQPQGATIDGVTSVVGVDLVGGLNSGGDGTFYDVGLGSCGDTNVDSDLLVAVSEDLYDSYPGATANPNLNPICGRNILVTFNGKSVTVPVKDRCTGCAALSLDFSPAAFNMLSDPSVGRIHNIQWKFIS